MVITSKYPSKCPSCNGMISVGQTVEWNKGSRARHVSCATSRVAPGMQIAGGKTSASQSGSRKSYVANRGMRGCSDCSRLGRMCSQCSFDEFDS